jgi:rsbT co-antagonist protein RsbR
VLRTLTGKVAIGAALVLAALVLNTLVSASSTLTLGSLMRRVTTYSQTERSFSDAFNANTARAIIEIQALMLGGRRDAQLEAEGALTRATQALRELEAQSNGGIISAELTTEHQRLNQDRRMLLGALQNLLQDAQEASAEGRAGIARMRPVLEALEVTLDQVNTKSNSVMLREQQLVAAQTEGGVRQVLLQLGASLVALVLVVVTIVVLLRRAIVTPILTLAGAARAFGEGALSGPTLVTREDELGDLQGAFATMTGTIAQSQRTLREQVAAAEAARAQAEAAQAALAAQLEVVAQQREVIREMSVPVLPVNRSTLVMPLIGALDTGRLSEIQQRALEEIERHRARRLLLDVTGVSIIDTQVAQGLLGIVAAGRLLGATVVLIGVRPEVAQTMVSLGIELSTIQVARDLQGALQLH